MGPPKWKRPQPAGNRRGPKKRNVVGNIDAAEHNLRRALLQPDSADPDLLDAARLWWLSDALINGFRSPAPPGILIEGGHDAL